MKTLLTIAIIAATTFLASSQQVDSTNYRNSEQLLAEGIRPFEIERGWIGYKETKNGEDQGLVEFYWDRFGNRSVQIRKTILASVDLAMYTNIIFDGEKQITITRTVSLETDETRTYAINTTYQSGETGLLYMNQEGLTKVDQNVRAHGEHELKSITTSTTESIEGKQILGKECYGIRLNSECDYDGPPKYGETALTSHHISYSFNQWYHKGICFATISGNTESIAVKVDFNKDFGEEVFSLSKNE